MACTGRGSRWSSGTSPNNVGAYHELGSNAIVMNRNIVKIVWRSTRSRSKRNAFTFMILLHEYLHALGFTEEAQVSDLGKKIADDFLGKGHIAGEMAMKPLDQFFPQMPQLCHVQGQGPVRDRGAVRLVQHPIHPLRPWAAYSEDALGTPRANSL